MRFKKNKIQKFKSLKQPWSCKAMFGLVYAYRDQRHGQQKRLLTTIVAQDQSVLLQERLCLRNQQFYIINRPVKTLQNMRPR